MKDDTKATIGACVILGGALAGVAGLIYGLTRLQITEDKKSEREANRLEQIVKDETQRGELPLFRGSLDELNSTDSAKQYAEEKILFLREYQGGLNTTLNKVYEELRKQGYDGLVQFNLAHTHNQSGPIITDYCTVQGMPVKLKKKEEGK